MTKRNAITISVIFHAALLSFLAIYFVISTPTPLPPPISDDRAPLIAILDPVKPPPIEEEKPPLPIREDVAKIDSTVDKIPLRPNEETDIAIGPIEEIIDAPPPSTGNSPTPTSKSAPVYPEGAIKRGISGKVVALLTVGPDGKVINVEIESADPEGVFERSTIKALSKWTYAPEFVTNVSTNPNRTIRVEVEYDLKDLEAGR